VVTIQRDWGDRTDRKHARLKYTIEDHGLDAFRVEVECRSGVKLGKPKAFAFTSTGDRYGWSEGENGRAHLTLFIENGRIKDLPGAAICTGLRRIAENHDGDIRLTTNQNIIVANVAQEKRPAIEALVAKYGLTAHASAPAPRMVHVRCGSARRAFRPSRLRTRRSRERPMSVYTVVQPIHILQTPTHVTMINEGGQEVRRIWLNVPHAANPKPTWYGDSVGNYEGGDTLVVDTIGQTTKTFVDPYLTPHTEQLHVIERYKLTDGGKAIDISIHVEDPGAFTTPWNAKQRFRRIDREWEEDICAENNADFLHCEVVPLPHADRPDF
jgi:hypothetical protein